MNDTVEGGPQPEPIYAVVFGCIMVLGLPLNAVSLWILLRRHSLRSPNVVFMVNLAISDLLLAISLPMRVYFYATGTWPLGSSVCILTTEIYRKNISCSSIFITFICVDRLLAVVYPLRSRHLRTSSNAWKAVVFVWLFVLLMNIPQSLSMSRALKNCTVAVCFDYHHCWTYDPAWVYFYVALVFTMLAVNVVCTTLVSWTLRSHLSDSAKVRNKVNVMLIFFMNLVMFTVCFIPLYVGLLTIKGTAIRPLVCLATMNCCLDPLMYYFSLDNFWKKKEDVDLETREE
ncbi:lysophosphatidic acid receptor 6-like [Acanthopagrus latus]|uniref:lysophosphatidic acid receptor 6-like n=1 Tax=Acanthopagrus latus TaxID=8177 RepID=UPI00187BF0BC|nr:lysophosphatidic acid receptor 6-like [Acanthopagrus latus]